MNKENIGWLEDMSKRVKGILLEENNLERMRRLWERTGQLSDCQLWKWEELHTKDP